MKKPLAALLCCFSFILSTSIANAQFGVFASGVWLSNCSQNNFFNTSGSGTNLLGPAVNQFDNTNLGVYTQNSGTLSLGGGGVKTSKPSGTNVCAATLRYSIHLQSAPAGTFTAIDLPHNSDCDISTNQFPGGGGGCTADGDQLWKVTSSGVDLTNLSPGNYALEVYFEVSGSNSATTGCGDNLTSAHYKATFSIQAPTFASNNPVTCNGSDGFITISGLVAGANYNVSYTKNGSSPATVNLTANGSGQIVIPNLSAGIYSNFLLKINGCTTNLFVGIVLSNPIFIPTFPAIAPFCAGTPAPVLPATSTNGIAGSWTPATIDNENSGNYIFTPNSNTCGIPTSLSVVVNPRITPTFTFGTSLTICAGEPVPALPTTSTNSISGTWSPATVDDQHSGTYTFTPTSGQCTDPATFTVTVNPNVTPVFSFGTSLSICAGDPVPALPDTSTNNLTGTWSPATIDAQHSGAYLFTPDAGQCASPVTLSVTVNPIVNPTFTFGTSLIICEAGMVPILPTISNNGITGAWSPTVVDNQTTATYLFTPDPGQCAQPASFAVTVNLQVKPTFSFGIILTICAGGSVPTLPTTSQNGISGLWTPSVIDNQNSGVYTFTPSAGQCATTNTFTVHVNPNLTPTFSFGTSLTICAGATVPRLPDTSANALLGTWLPKIVDAQNSGAYTFTPINGQCALPTIFNVTVNPNVTPAFSFGTTLSICSGTSVPTLPGTSTNGITGAWTPAIIDNQTLGIGTYTFKPDPSQCASTVTFSVTVKATITPTFDFGTTASICNNGTVPTLPTTSNNGITGTWLPAIVDNQHSGTYTFTPSSSQCATTQTFTVTINAIVTPTFDFGTTLTICAGGDAPVLATTSTNGITGTWDPTVIDVQTGNTYLFTPDANQCAVGTNLVVTITPVTVPVFTIGTSLSVCTGGTVPALPSTSTNSIDGVWDPAIVSNQASATYTFTPTATPQQCVANATYAVTVNPIVAPTFAFGTSLSICIGATVPTLTASSTNNITGTWSPTTIDNLHSGQYIFTPDVGQCATALTLKVDVNEVPTVVVRGDTTLNDGDLMPVTILSGTPPSAIFNWVNSAPGIGLSGSGTGDIPSFHAINQGNDQVKATITVTPQNGGCLGTPATFNITVIPLSKDIFVPNVFTPNGDGKNDKLFAYGNYVDKLEMHIFNQWGQQIAVLNNISQGWDGTQSGKPQPVGVYVYVLKAVMTDGRIIKLKGSITLLR